MGILKTKEGWEEAKRKGGIVKSVLHSDLFFKYLGETKGKTCLEIGCVPGVFLTYLCKNFGYFPEGIDYVSDTEKITGETLKINGINEYRIYEEDFITWNLPKKYDLVCSFGFIEHFTGPTEEKVIRKHIELLKPGGKLILEVPNFNYGQYLIRFFLTRKILNEHNIAVMNLGYFRRMAKEFDLKILYLGYCGGTFRLWADRESLTFPRGKIYTALKLLEANIKRAKMDKINNRFFSPFILFIAQK